MSIIKKPTAPKPKIEYRIRCAAYGLDPGHASHVYTKPTREKAAEACAFNNTTPYGKDSMIESVVPGHRACALWRIEARVVAPWENPDDAEELAAMLVRDWWDWGGEVPPMTLAFQ